MGGKEREGRTKEIVEEEREGEKKESVPDCGKDCGNDERGDKRRRGVEAGGNEKEKDEQKKIRKGEMKS